MDESEAECDIMDNGSDIGAENAANEPTTVGDKRKSDWWAHFWDIRDPKSGKILKAKCKYCARVLSANTNNGTSSLKKHLSTCRYYLPNADKKQKLISTFRTSTSETTTMTNWQFDQNATRLALAKMVIIDEQPFSIVEHEGFRLFCSVATPQFTIPSRFTVARDVKTLFLSESDKLKNTLKGLRSRVALTTDCWTSIQNFNYLCLTSHFIDDNWKLHKRILNFRLMDSHKGKEIGKVVEECIIKWGIEDRLSCLTVDNASSNDVAVGYLKSNLHDKLLGEGELFHMRCACHVLNLIVRDGLSKIKNSISNIHSAVRYVRSSPARAKSFAHSTMLAKVSCKASVCLDVSTRWNSTFIMLETALKFEKAFNRFKEDDHDFSRELKDGVPTKEDWINDRVLAMCLKGFYEATKRMSGSLYVTSNMHFHEILSVLASLLKWENSTNSDIRGMASQMREKFDKYYGDLVKTNMMMLVAVILDPRYKYSFVRFSLKKIYSKDLYKVDEIANHLYDVFKNLFECYHVLSISKNDGEDARSMGLDGDNQEPNQEVTNNEDLRELYDEFMMEEGGGVGSKSELDKYFEDPKEKRIEGDFFDILKWWKDRSEKYPALALMARDVLAIPVSTVSSESAFSTSGRVLDQFRSSLGPKTVEALVCAQDWLRASEICIDIERFLEDGEKYEEELDDNGVEQVDNIFGR